MKNRDWENWLTGLRGTQYGEMKRETMKSMNSPTVNTKYPNRNMDNKKAIDNPTSINYSPRTTEDIHYSQENLIANIILLIFLGFLTFVWFSSPDITLEWYWFFGVGLAIVFTIDWLLKNPFRIILSLIRIAIKLLLYIVLIGTIISVLYYLFGS